MVFRDILECQSGGEESCRMGDLNNGFSGSNEISTKFKELVNPYLISLHIRLVYKMNLVYKN